MIRFAVIAALLTLTGCKLAEQQQAAEAERQARLRQAGENIRQMCVNSGYADGTAEQMMCRAKLATLYVYGPYGPPQPSPVYVPVYTQPQRPVHCTSTRQGVFVNTNCY